MEEIVIAEEAENERIGRVLIDLLRRVILLDIAGIDHRHTVGDFECLFLIVRHEDCRDLDRIVQFAQPTAQFTPDSGIERTERLIEQQHLRLDRQGAGERDALALAARELRGIALGEIAELNERQKLIDLRLNLCVRGPLAPGLGAQAESDILEHAHLLEQCVVLEYKANLALAEVGVGDIDAVE